MLLHIEVSTMDTQQLSVRAQDCSLQFFRGQSGDAHESTPLLEQQMTENG